MGHKERFIKPDFSDINRLQDLLAYSIKSFQEQHSQVEPIISPNLTMSYGEDAPKFSIPMKPLSIENTIDQIIPLFGNCINWSSPGAMFNVTPPSNIVGNVLNVLTSLCNPNLAEDRSGGLMAYAEQEVIKCLSGLVGWHEDKVSGHACFGGKATNSYAVKYAIKSCKNLLKDQFDIKNCFYITNDLSHPCQKEAVELHGIPNDNNIVIRCDQDGCVDLESLKSAVKERLNLGQIFLGMTINAGTTMEYAVDDIQKLVSIRDQVIAEYKLTYTPKVHADAVLGWVWLFAERLDEVNIPENILPSSVEKIKRMYEKIKWLKLVDSFGVDFHKLGYTAYQSSFYLSQSNGSIDVESLKYGQLSTYQNTIELSRGAQGVVGALSSLLSFGYEGYINLILSLVNSVDIIRKELSYHPNLEVLYPESLGVCNVVCLTHIKPLDENISDKDLAIVHSLNKMFVGYVCNLVDQGEINFFTWHSQSYLVPGNKKRYGGLKLYGTSPFLEKECLENFLNSFKNHVNIFMNSEDVSKLLLGCDAQDNEQKDPFHPIF
tara:strand:+ start:2121 stop:3761 length:1641 start_codon:yes stop_codon:yes gene_type:complete